MYKAATTLLCSQLNFEHGSLVVVLVGTHLSVLEGKQMKIGSVLLLAMLGLGCGGYGSSPNMTTPQPGVVPTIKSLTPSSMNSGGLAFTLTVNGTGFARNAVVKWNGTEGSTRYVKGRRVMG